MSDFKKELLAKSEQQNQKLNQAWMDCFNYICKQIDFKLIEKANMGETYHNIKLYDLVVSILNHSNYNKFNFDSMRMYGAVIQEYNKRDVLGQSDGFSDVITFYFK